MTLQELIELYKKAGLDEEAIRRVVSNVGLNKAPSILSELASNFSQFQPERGVSPRGVAQLGQNAGRWIRPVTGLGGFADIGLLSNVAGITGAGLGGYAIGQQLNKTPLITDPNTTYGQFYQQALSPLASMGIPKTPEFGQKYNDYIPMKLDEQLLNMTKSRGFK